LSVFQPMKAAVSMTYSPTDSPSIPSSAEIYLRRIMLLDRDVMAARNAEREEERREKIAATLRATLKSNPRHATARGKPTRLPPAIESRRRKTHA
jgi:hypothetical protein